MQTVMAMMALMTVLAAAMVAVYTSSLNHVQAFSNGELAQAEADSAISELLARLHEDPAYGTSGEEISGTQTPGLDPGQAFHVLTFSSSSSYPHSTNAIGGSASGSLGRSVPAGHVHAVATGYCRGQYRTVEALIEHPPFPYGLSSSGAINSRTALVVKGTSGNWRPGDEDRPGHLVSNSPGGVRIGRTAGAQTYITGFIKSVGDISVEQQATVLEGLHPNAGPVGLPDINLETFANSGEAGVIEILDSEFPAQVLDVMYHSNHSVRYNGPVEMRDAFLFSRGDVTVYGGLTGVGAIVALGDVNIFGGADLDGSNNIAILAQGKITLAGGGNFFRGILYAENGIDARKVTVVGNAIANNPASPEAASVDLEDVILISSDITSSFNFTARSNRRARRQRNAGRVPFRLDTSDGTFPSQTLAVGVSTAGKSEAQLRYSVKAHLSALWPASGPSEIKWNPEYKIGEIGGEVGNIARMFSDTYAFLEQAQILQTERNALSAEAGSASGSALDDINRRIGDIDTELAAIRAQFDIAVERAEQAYLEYALSAANSDGAYLDDGFLEPDVEKEYTIDLNTYIPESDDFRVGYYQVFGRRM